MGFFHRVLKNVVIITLNMLNLNAAKPYEVIFFLTIPEASMLFLGLILPMGPTLLTSNYLLMPAHIFLLDTIGKHHLLYVIAQMK